MKKWNLIVDVERCENCNNCTMTCKDEYYDNTFEGYSLPQPRHGHNWIRIETKERGSGSLFDVAYKFSTCNQCENAPCIAASDGAVKRRADGIVIIDPVKSKGRKEIVSSCPHGHIWWNEELEVPQKWSFDAHLLDSGWDSPRCVQVCATGCLRAVKCTDEEMGRIAEKENLETDEAARSNKPHVWYKNLHRFSREFIAGSASWIVGEIEDAVPGAEVVLKKNGETVGSQTTDYFGDFKFDGLEPESGSYEININAEGFENYRTEVNLSESIYLGALKLAALKHRSSN